MRALKVLFLPHPLPELQTPWGDDVVVAVRKRHELRIFDRQQPAVPQFDQIEVVVDLGGNISAELVDVAAKARVRFVQVQTNGLDHVEVDKILDAGMLLAHCPGDVSSVALAESAMMFLLLLAKRYKEGIESFEQRRCFFPAGIALEGRSLGIVGFGASGLQLARRAKAFGMQIMAIDTRPIEQEILDEIQPTFLGGSDDLDRVVAECDFLSVHLHLTAETHHIIDARRIGLMKPTACLINVARGSLVDESALYEALMNGRIGGAGLDAFAQEPANPTLPVYQLPNVYVTPHTAAASDRTSLNRAQLAADNLDRYARGEQLAAQVTSR